MARHDSLAPALPRPAREGLGDHRPQLAVRSQGDPGLPARGRPAELAGLPVRCSIAGSGPGSWCPCSPWGSRSASSGSPPTTWAMIRPATRSTCSRSRGVLRGPTSAASPRSTRPGAASTRSPIRTTRPRWRCRSTSAGRSRGEDVTTSVWQSYPVPALQGFSVQPRSLSMFRAEQMVGLSGPIALEARARPANVVVNRSDLELRDAVLVDFSDSRQRREVFLGTIAPGGVGRAQGVGEPHGAGRPGRGV